jgi:WD40 repeat protein
MVFPKRDKLFATPDGKLLYCKGTWIDLASGSVVPSPYRAKWDDELQGFLKDGTAIVGSVNNYRLYDRAGEQPVLIVKKDGWCAFDGDARQVIRGEFTSTKDESSSQVFSKAPFPAKGEPTEWKELFRLDWKDLNWLYFSDNASAVAWIYSKPSKKIGYRHFATGKTWTIDPPMASDVDVELALAPDGSKLVVSAGTKLTVYDTATGKPVVSRDDFATDSCRDIQVNPNCRGCVLRDGWSCLFYIPFDENEKVVQLSNSARGVQSTVCLPDGKRVAVLDRNGVVRLYDLATGQECDEHSQYSDWSSIQFVGRNTVGCWNSGEVMFWDALTGLPDRRTQLESDTSKSDSMRRLSPNGKQLSVFLKQGQTRVFDTTTGKKLLQVEETAGLVVGDLTTNGRVAVPVVGSKEAHIIADGCDLYDLATNKRTHQIRTFPHAIHALAPDGRTLAAANSGQVQLHELATGKLRWVQDAMSGTENSAHGVDRLEFDSGGRQLFLFRSGDITVLDVRTGKQTARLTLETTGPDKKLAKLRTVSRSGRWVAGLVQNQDDTSQLLLVDLSGENPEEYSLTVPISENVVSQIILDDAARRLVTCERGGECVVWDLEAWLKPHLRPKRVTKIDGRTPWEYLADQDPVVAQKGMDTLHADPDGTVKLFEKLLPPADAIPEVEVTKWISELSNQQFAVRDAASKKLEAIADQIEKTLRLALEASHDLEQQQRLEAILARLANLPFDTKRLQQIRAVEILERIQTPSAVKLLKKYAMGANNALLTREAKDSCRRMNE